MDYETGVASSPADLLSKLDVFLAANGWTVNVPGSLVGRVYSKGAIYCGAESDASGFWLRGALGFNSALAWNNQTNRANDQPYCNTGAGPFTAYHFFAGAESSKEYFNVVVEISAGVFRHAIVSDLIKFGAWTGGTYVDSTWWSSSSSFMNQPESNRSRVICDSQPDLAPSGAFGHVWVDNDGFTNHWSGLFDNISDLNSALGSVRTRGFNWNPYNIGYARWNLRTILEPLTILQNRPGSLRSPIGRVPNMRFVSLVNNAPGDLFTIGGDTWMLFPIISRTDTWGSGSSSIPSSGHAGYAYLRP